MDLIITFDFLEIIYVKKIIYNKTNNFIAKKKNIKTSDFVKNKQENGLKNLFYLI